MQSASVGEREVEGVETGLCLSKILRDASIKPPIVCVTTSTCKPIQHKIRSLFLLCEQSHCCSTDAM